MNSIKIDSNNLKILALFTMLIDHFAGALVPERSIVQTIMLFVGRFTAPVMFFLISEGYFNTSNIKKYILRLLFLAIISHIPFNLFYNYGELGLFPTSVIFTLLCGLLALRVLNQRINIFLKTTLIILLVSISNIGDWGIFGVLYILVFGAFRSDKKLMVLLYVLVFISNLATKYLLLGSNNFEFYSYISDFGVLAILPLIMKYNGERKISMMIRNLFYISYPLNFIIVGLIYILVKGGF